MRSGVRGTPSAIVIEEVMVRWVLSSAAENQMRCCVIRLAPEPGSATAALLDFERHRARVDEPVLCLLRVGTAVRRRDHVTARFLVWKAHHSIPVSYTHLRAHETPEHL